MTRKSVHTPVVTPDELRAMGIDVGPNSPLNDLKPRRKPGEFEHKAQVRLFEKLDEAAKTDRGRRCLLDKFLPAIHAIPNFNANIKGDKAKIIGAKFKREGQRAGMLDVNVPVQKKIVDATVSDPAMRNVGTMAGLYLELKYEAYPSPEQRAMAKLLCDGGNVVLVIRIPDVEKLAAAALETILRYLESDASFTAFAHPDHIHIPF